MSDFKYNIGDTVADYIINDRTVMPERQHFINPEKKFLDSHIEMKPYYFCEDLNGEGFIFLSEEYLESLTP